MLKRMFNKELEKDLCIHIFTVSAAMVGVCLTVIGLLRVVITLKTATNFADDLVSLDAVCFLLSCMTSYWALRTRNHKRLHQLEKFADVVFLFAMTFMAFICLYITYAIGLTGVVH